MRNVAAPVCRFGPGPAGCPTVPSYGYPPGAAREGRGGPRAQACATHRMAGMVLSNSKKHCAADNCFKEACFNQEGESRGIFCNQHKADGMINIKRHRTRKCEFYKGCRTQPHYNFPSSKSLPPFCYKHRMAGMVLVPRVPRCQRDQLRKGKAQPSTRTDDSLLKYAKINATSEGILPNHSISMSSAEGDISSVEYSNRNNERCRYDSIAYPQDDLPLASFYDSNMVVECSNKEDEPTISSINNTSNKDHSSIHLEVGAEIFPDESSIVFDLIDDASIISHVLETL